MSYRAYAEDDDDDDADGGGGDARRGDADAGGDAGDAGVARDDARERVDGETGAESDHR